MNSADSATPSFRRVRNGKVLFMTFSGCGAQQFSRGLQVDLQLANTGRRFQSCEPEPEAPASSLP
jgi:hypothetical protein